MSAASDALRSLWALPSNWRARIGIATRAATSMAVPLGLLTALGQPGLGLQATVGVFTALYAASSNAAERAKVLPFVGATMIACAGLGTLLAPTTAGLLTGLVLVAVVCSSLAYAFRLGPPGPMFFVMVYGLSSNITSVHDGRRANDPWLFMALVVAGTLFSYLVSIAPLARRAERAKPVRPLRELLPGPWLGAGETTLIARVAAVAVLGAILSLSLMDPQRGYWTVTSGVAVIGLTADRGYAVGRGLHRIVGTLLGAAFYLLLAPMAQHPWMLVVILAALQFCIELIVVENYGLALSLVTPVVLLITTAAAGSPDVWGTAAERLIDTVIGAVLGAVSGLLHPRPRPA